MEVLDIVEAILPFKLHCGTGIYPHAIVVNVKPLVCVSVQGDMLWTCTVTPDNVKVVGRADEGYAKLAMHRYKNHLISMKEGAEMVDEFIRVRREQLEEAKALLDEFHRMKVVLEAAKSFLDSLQSTGNIPIGYRTEAKDVLLALKGKPYA